MKLKASINLILIALLCLLPCLAHAQTDQTTEIQNTVETTTDRAVRPGMNAEIPTTNVLYQNKRINLVVFVLATIFAGIILYLVRIERKLNKLEKNNN